MALALFVFAQHRPDGAYQFSGFHNVIDLAYAVPVHSPELRRMSATRSTNFSSEAITSTYLDAPAHFAPSLWTVDEIPANRLIAPLVVMDVRDKTRKNCDYQISVGDIAAWEQAHGNVPAGAVVIANTGWNSRWDSPANYINRMHFPGYTRDAAQFLVEGRNILGLGIDTLSVDAGASKDFAVHEYTLAHSVYHLENVTNLDQVPAAGSIVVIAPEKLQGAKTAPVRVLAMVR